MTPLKMQVEDLANAIPQLPEGDRNFASSLVSQFMRRGLSAKQASWVPRLIERAGKPAEPKTISIGSLKGVVDLLERAQKHLKYPAVLMLANGRTLRLNIAGAGAKAPGSINVCSDGRYGDRAWYGRVTRDGQFEPCRKFDAETQSAVAAALTALAMNPAKAAAEYGHLTGVCCFCGIVLTDERSTEVGYGPVCARHYGLPWGAKR